MAHCGEGTIDRQSRGLRRRVAALACWLLILGGGGPAAADGICSQIVQCILTTARGQLPAGGDVCGVCGGSGYGLVTSIQQAAANPSITSGCGAANQVLWVAQAIAGANLQTSLQSVACALTGGTFGQVQTCQSGCQTRCYNDFGNFWGAPSNQLNACLADCGCGIVPSIVCGGAGEAWGAQKICQAVGLDDSSAPPTTMALVSSLNVQSVAALTTAALLQKQVLYISNRATCGYLLPNGTSGLSNRLADPNPPTILRYSPHSPALWQLEDAGSGTVRVRAQISGLYLTVKNGTLQSVYPADGASAWQFTPSLGQNAGTQPLAMTFSISNAATPSIVLAAGAASGQGVAPVLTAPPSGSATLAEWTVQPYGPEAPFGSAPPPCPP